MPAPPSATFLRRQDAAVYTAVGLEMGLETPGGGMEVMGGAFDSASSSISLCMQLVNDFFLFLRRR
jgi:hypothetical protein